MSLYIIKPSNFAVVPVPCSSPSLAALLPSLLCLALFVCPDATVGQLPVDAHHTRHRNRRRTTSLLFPPPFEAHTDSHGVKLHSPASGPLYLASLPTASRRYSHGRPFSCRRRRPSAATHFNFLLISLISSKCVGR